MPEWEDDDHTVVGESKLAEVLLERGAERAYVIVIAGPNLGETHELRAETDVGRTSETTIHLTDSEVSRRHAKFFSDETGRVLVEDLGSTNGTFVNGERVHQRALQDGDKIQIGTTTILKFSYHDALDQAFQRRMYDAAIRDGLTGAYNKKHFSERLASELAYAIRHRSALALVLFDLDHFKRLNDTFGHQAGDYVLSTLAKGVLDAIRKEDLFARWGGEEFALICRGIDGEGGRLFAERLRAWVEAYPFVYEGRRMPVTTSLGVVAVPDVGVSDPGAFLQCADEALYDAKHGGRNRVAVWQPRR